MTPMPIYNKICRSHVCCANTPADRAFVKNLIEDIHQSVKVDISRAYRVYAEKKTDDIGPADWPYCVPPWPLAWLEFDMGGLFRASGLEQIKPPTPAGAICISLSRESGDKRFSQALKAFSGHLYAESKATADDIEHIALIRPWGTDRSVDKAAFDQGFLLAALIATNGQVIGIGANYEPTQMNQILAKAGAMFVFAHVVMFAFSLANCKNIVAEQQRGYYRPPGASKAHKKFYRYHVLKIDGSHTGTREGKGGHRDTPMHICRGHFKRFTEEKPLFGRLTGLYWWPMHVRGSVKHGVVDKDYALAPAGQN